jgi:hypothetical protein
VKSGKWPCVAIESIGYNGHAESYQRSRRKWEQWLLCNVWRIININIIVCQWLDTYLLLYYWLLCV